jgi:hypothetical protein
VSYDDQVRRLAAEFRPDDRYRNFEPLIQSMEIHGFRGVRSLTLTSESSVTAFSGLNGTGRAPSLSSPPRPTSRQPTPPPAGSTSQTSSPVSPADPEPSTSDAWVVYTYGVQRGADPHELTVRREVEEWSDYKQQPERARYCIGFTQFIPEVERRDFSVYRGHLLELGTSRPLPEHGLRGR